jgi:hypothetical protein
MTKLRTKRVAQSYPAPSGITLRLFLSSAIPERFSPGAKDASADRGAFITHTPCLQERSFRSAAE